MARPREFDLDDFYDRAMELFWARGFASTSMADIYAATGLGPGSVYGVVKDKDELFRRVFERYAVGFREMMGGKLRGLPAISAWFDLQVAFLTEDPERKGCLVANTVAERGAHTQETLDLAQARLAEMRSYFLKQVVQGQADGSVAAHLHRDTAADGLLGSAMGLMALARARAPKRTLQRIAAGAIEGLRPPA